MHLAALNIARLIAPTDDPRVADFMANLDRINSLGKRMPGFVWMMEGDGGANTGNTDTKLFGDPLYVANLTVWEDGASLDRFVHKTVHARFLARKADWFEQPATVQFVMWDSAPGHCPTLEAAMERLTHLQTHGDSDYAFGWTWMRQRQGI